MIITSSSCMTREEDKIFLRSEASTGDSYGLGRWQAEVGRKEPDGGADFSAVIQVVTKDSIQQRLVSLSS